VSEVDQWLAVVLPRRCAFCNAPCGGRCACAGCEADLPWLAVAAPGRVWAALSYEYPVDRLVAAAKFHRELHAARTLGELLALHLDRARPGPPPDLLVPVPLHRRRLAARGYNQAVEIARPLAALSGAPLALRLCERTRATPEQSGLPAAARRRNLRGAFAARGRCDGARVAIVDDVVTTGSTAAALARALRDAGAAEVEVWAAARAL
jgi:ComF family protein